jgi:hypothetical protein
MADQKISELTELTAPASDDVLPIVDTDAGATKKITTANLGKATKIDDLAAPDNNNDLNATTSAHGLLPKLDNNSYNFLDGDGNWANPMFSLWQDYIHWNSIDGWTTSGTVTLKTPNIRVVTAASLNAVSGLRTGDGWPRVYWAGKTFIVEWQISYHEGAPSNEQISLFICSDFTSIPPSLTANHFGFYINGTDIYASNADGSTEKATDTTINLADGDNERMSLRVEFSTGVNVKYYINNSLVVTHTENLPTDQFYGMSMSIKTTDTSAKAIWLGRIRLAQY